MLIVFKEKKTNWKYLLIVFILGFIVGSGTIWLTKQQEAQFAQITIQSGSKTEKVKTLEEVITEVLPIDFTIEDSQYFIDDLDEDGKSEIIITAVKLKDYIGQKGYFYAITILNEMRNYEEVGKLEYNQTYRGIPTVKEVKDIDNDNQKEIFLSLAFGGASAVAEGILDWDASKKELDWVKYEDELNSTEEAIFYIGATVMHHHSYTVDDYDKDGQKEIIEIDAWSEYKEPEYLKPWEASMPVEGTEGMWWRCQSRAYEWDGLIFSYNEELSRNLASRFKEGCRIEGLSIN